MVLIYHTFFKGFELGNKVCQSLKPLASTARTPCKRRYLDGFWFCGEDLLMVSGYWEG